MFAEAYRYKYYISKIKDNVSDIALGTTSKTPAEIILQHVSFALSE